MKGIASDVLELAELLVRGNNVAARLGLVLYVDCLEPGEGDNPELENSTASLRAAVEARSAR